MTLKYYYDLLSQPSRALYMFLKVTNTPFEPCVIKLLEGEHMEEDFGNINPFRKVPVIDDNGFKLTESVAILRYLAKTRPIADHWYPADTKLRAKVDEYMEWQHANTRIFCAMYFQHKFFRPMLFKRPADEKQVKQSETEMLKCLETISTVWLDDGKKKFICGEEISVADLLAVCELEQTGMAGFDIFSNYPIIGEYRERVRQATQPHYDDAHKNVEAIIKRFNGVPDMNASLIDHRIE